MLLALALGAHYANGVGGVLILVAVAALLAAAFASLSNGVAMLARQRETLIGAVSFVLLALTFLSTPLMQQGLIPDWIRTVATFNPVNRAVEAGRSAAMQHIDWGLVGSRAGMLAALMVVCAVFATHVRQLSALTLNAHEVVWPSDRDEPSVQQPVTIRPSRKASSRVKATPPGWRISHRSAAWCPARKCTWQQKEPVTSVVDVADGGGNDTRIASGSLSMTPAGRTDRRTSVPVAGQFECTSAGCPSRAGRNRVSHAHQV